LVDRETKAGLLEIINQLSDAFEENTEELDLMLEKINEIVRNNRNHN